LILISILITTDAEFAESISKWLVQAPLRTQREM